MAKVLIVDDNAFIRHALSEIFNRESDFQVCGEAENGKEAIEKAWELHPDLIVLDPSARQIAVPLNSVLRGYEYRDPQEGCSAWNSACRFRS